MDKVLTFVDDLQSKLDRANALLETLCSGLEADKVPLPPELLSWWIDHKKELEEAEKPCILLVN